jgi:hypothetical protein
VIASIDFAGNIVRTCQNEEDPHFLKLNLDFYHLSRSATLITMGWNQHALNELKLVKGGSEYQRRQAYKDILQARAYVNRSEYSIGISLAETALHVAQKINSGVNVTRVIKLYQQLQQSPYKHSPDVARLGYMLRLEH